MIITVDLIILQFLFAIAGVETNHGQNLNHRTIASQSSMHYNHKAIGKWGLMPNTVLMLKRDLNRFKTDDLYQKQVAMKYALKILRASKGCPLTASILWLRGPNGRPTALDYSSPRYKRFILEWEAISQTPIEKDTFILKYCTQTRQSNSI